MDQVGAARWWWRAVVPLLVVQLLGAALIAVPSARALGLLVSVTAWIVMMVVIWPGVAVDRRQGVDRSQAQARTARNIGLFGAVMLLVFTALLIVLAVVVVADTG
jgi:hypothetical protein